MTKRTLYPLKKLPLYYEIKNLTMEGGTIESAIFENPRLLEYRITFPEGYFPSEFYEKTGFDVNEKIPLTLSPTNTVRNDIIFTGISSGLYSRLVSEDVDVSKILDLNRYRFRILMEQQSIISIVSAIETFIKNVLNDHDQKPRFHHYFKDIEKVLKKCEIVPSQLELLREKNIYNRTKEIVDFAFNLRNLYVHNGGIVDEWFYEKYKKILSPDIIGKLIRIEYDDYEIIRQWISLFIQEICRVLEDYEKVWSDYIFSVGIILPNIDLFLKTIDGEKIPLGELSEGVEMVGVYEDEISDKKEKSPPKRKKRTFGFQIDYDLKNLKMTKKTTKELEPPYKIKKDKNKSDSE